MSFYVILPVVASKDELVHLVGVGPAGGAPDSVESRRNSRYQEDIRR